MKLLIYQWNDYLHYDLYDICRHKRIDFDTFQWRFANKNEDPAFIKWFTSNINCKYYSALVSVNYFPILAQICHDNNLIYIAWCYDNPLNVEHIEDTLSYHTNYVFLFDKIQCHNYVKKGISTVYHMPLGVNSRRLANLRVFPADHQKYDSDVTFVGNLYPSKIHELLKLMDEYTKGFLTSLMDVQAKIYGYYFFDELVTDEIITKINKLFHLKNPHTQFYLSKEALVFAMSSEITRNDRIMLLNLLGNRCDVHFHSYDRCNLIKNVKCLGSLDYVSGMPKAFRCAKINLNPSLRIIQTGIPLRAFDIMGAGGFLLSNWQEELAELYIDGTDMVLYQSIEDAIDKALFYLKHEDLRKKITLSGQEKTLRKHNLEDILSSIFSLAKIS